MAQEFTSREMGLLKVASSHKHTVHFYEKDIIPHIEKYLFQSFLSSRNDETIWEYLEEHPKSFWKNINSKELGIKTIIKDYTNAKGIVKLAHYTYNNQYYGSTHSLGKTPVFYQGNFAICRERFNVIYPQNPKELSDFFVVKPIDDDDIPLAQLRRNVVIDDDDIPLAQLRRK
jgi:hypothetical protein